MLRFGTVGSSWITEEYIRGAKDSGLWELTAVYSRSFERGKEFADKYGAGYIFTDIDEMASSDVIDAVYIASPNAFHYEQCKAFLTRGKHVICEKPLCAQSHKVKELQLIASENNAVFMEAIMFMHLPQLKLLQDELAGIGEIKMAKLDFCQRSSKLDSYLAGNVPNIFNPELETGGLMDLGVYCVYPALLLFGKPDDFNINIVPMRTGIDGAGIIDLIYPDKLVTITYSKLGQAGANSDFQGTGGTICVESISRLAGIYALGRDEEPRLIHGEDEKYKLMGYEAKDFYRYITEPESSKDEYELCSRMSADVSEFMEQARHKAGIKFPSDE